ncbi:hypothetical protein [Sphingobacterium daejeonense]|uniref:hypothetical protein n=1 Tax=Sphingobacterium daejeonense TaxID=371142 RepID=UPI0010C488CB|nr:hypothetical protein [Sphingobacterium daejeonense]VTP96279.1 Uncharacterised protein [Sphingobacterium daejeonense]
MEVHNQNSTYTFKPIFFNKSYVHDKNKIQILKDSGEILYEIDEYTRQLKDLFVSRFPSLSTNEEQFLDFF